MVPFSIIVLEFFVLELFLRLNVTFEFFQEQYYHIELRCRVDSNVVTIDYVPVLVTLKTDLPIGFFSDVAVLNVPFYLQRALMRKLQKFLFLFYFWV